MMKIFGRVCAFLALLFFILANAAPVLADDATVGPLLFDGTGEGVAITETHYEPVNDNPDDHKGWAIITVTNTGTEAWGDMHFQIAGIGVDSVSWIEGGLFNPTYKLDNVPTPMTWVIDNDNPNATLDMFFYGNPVLPGHSATFSAYTDNTSGMLPFFGLCVWPTPVPEPATLAMLSIGGLMFIRKRR